MKTRMIALLFLLVAGIVAPAAADVTADLQAAAASQQVAFILVTDRGAMEVDSAREKIHDAMQQVEGSLLIELDRGDPANSELVAKYRLSGAPVPLILVAARNGVLAGGVPAARASTEQLAALVPSPKKAEILQSLQAGQAVFVIASRAGMATQPASSACAAACSAIPGNGMTVQIDLDDPAEASFIKQLKLDRKAMEPVTLVINAQGQLAGTYAGTPDIASLAQAATKKVGGCCPPTAQNPNASCGPAQK